MAELTKGARVKFHRSHDVHTVLTGAVEEVKETEVLIRTDPAGVLVWANAADVTAVKASLGKVDWVQNERGEWVVAGK